MASSSSSSSSKQHAPPGSAGADASKRARRVPTDEIRESAEARMMDEDEGQLAEMGEFEDPFEDEYESDGEIVDGLAQDEDDEDEGANDNTTKGMRAMELDDPGDRDMPTKAFIPGRDVLGEDEELVNDSTAYDLLHNLEVEWPCLSFDILHDGLGQQRITYPMTAYVVSGTQADRPHNNKLLIMKMSQLARTRHDDDDSDDDASDDDDTQDDPILNSFYIKHEGTVNRVRAMPQGPSHIVATWAETGKVHLWDVSTAVHSLDGPVADVSPTSISVTKPIHTFAGHSTEGFALDWSSTMTGRLTTGDCDGNIYVWSSDKAGTWTVNKRAYKGHTASVEDLQWSHVQKDIFASCSADQTIKVWDVRSKAGAQLSVQAHTSDVNVISWNRTASHLMVSGADDGSFAVWDLRNFKPNMPAAQFRWHREPVTAVEWHPSDESVLAVSGADDQITIWDLSLEKDAEAEREQGGDEDVPPQLLFIHQGQKDIKELHWHKQIPGLVVSTAATGFNVFKTISA